MKEKLLLLHGALGTKGQFDVIKESLQDYYDLYVMNFEGHGDNVSDKEFSIELFTRNVISFLELQGIKEVSIFGFSMGGYVGLNAALLEPAIVKKVVTLGTKFDWNESSASREVKLLNPETIKEKVPRYALKLSQDHGISDWKDVVLKTGKMMLQMGRGAKLSHKDFSNIGQPVVIGLGTKDNMVSQEESQNVSNLIPNAQWVLLEDVKHPIDKNDPMIIADFIRSAL